MKTDAEIKKDVEEELKWTALRNAPMEFFYRTIELPPGVDPSSIEATMSNGVLKIRIPKPSHAGAKKIEVKEGSN